MTTWQPPEGYTLTVQPAHQINTRGFAITDESPDDRRASHAGGLDVFEFDEDEPFVWRENDGTSVQASPEARAAAKAGTPLAGWSPNGHMRPIEFGVIPVQYVLTKDDDPTLGTVEPHDPNYHAIHGPAGGAS